jgi:hypothetical protein
LTTLLALVLIILSLGLPACAPGEVTSTESESSSFKQQAYQLVLMQAVSSRCKHYLNDWYGGRCAQELRVNFEKLDYLDPEGPFVIAFFQRLKALSSQRGFLDKLQKLSKVFDGKIKNRIPIDLYQETLAICDSNSDCALDILGAAMQDVCGKEVIELAEGGKLSGANVWAELNTKVQIPLCRGLLPQGSKLLPQLKYDTGGRQGSVYHFYTNAFIARKISENWIFPAMLNVTYEQIFFRPGSRRWSSLSSKLYQLGRINEILDPGTFISQSKSAQVVAVPDSYLGFAGAAWGAAPSSAARVLSYKQFSDLFQSGGFESAVTAMIRSIDPAVLK